MCMFFPRQRQRGEKRDYEHSVSWELMPSTQVRQPVPYPVIVLSSIQGCGDSPGGRAAIYLNYKAKFTVSINTKFKES